MEEQERVDNLMSKLMEIDVEINKKEHEIMILKMQREGIELELIKSL